MLFANEFILYALICGIGVATALSPIGCVVLWKRMTFLGDAIAHSATLGVVLGVLLSINITYMILLVSILFVLAIIQLKRQHTSDTLIAIFSHSFLAIGLLIIAFAKHIRVDIMSYLFGDLLMVNITDIIMILIVTSGILLWLVLRWKMLLSAAINEDLAVVEGINTKRLELEFMLIMAVLISLSIKIVGILLISSLLVIPAASARNLSQTPKQMMLFATIFGVLATISGIALSAIFDSPSGPAIVVSAVTIFLCSLICRRNSSVVV